MKTIARGISVVLLAAAMINCGPGAAPTSAMCFALIGALEAGTADGVLTEPRLVSLLDEFGWHEGDVLLLTGLVTESRSAKTADESLAEEKKRVESVRESMGPNFKGLIEVYEKARLRAPRVLAVKEAVVVALRGGDMGKARVTLRGWAREWMIERMREQAKSK